MSTWKQKLKRFSVIILYLAILVWIIWLISWVDDLIILDKGTNYRFEGMDAFRQLWPLTCTFIPALCSIFAYLGWELGRIKSDVVIEQYTSQKDRECQLRFHEADEMIKNAKELEKKIRKFVDEQKAEALAEMKAVRTEKDNAEKSCRQAEHRLILMENQLKKDHSKEKDVEMKLKRERERHQEELNKKSAIIRELKGQVKDLKLQKKEG